MNALQKRRTLTVAGSRLKSGQLRLWPKRRCAEDTAWPRNLALCCRLCEVPLKPLMTHGEGIGATHGSRLGSWWGGELLPRVAGARRAAHGMAARTALTARKGGVPHGWLWPGYRFDVGHLSYFHLRRRGRGCDLGQL